jgi:hypothetical protein
VQADGIQSIPRVKDSGDNLKEKGEVCPKRKSGTQNRKKPLMRGEVRGVSTENPAVESMNLKSW